MNLSNQFLQSVSNFVKAAMDLSENNQGELLQMKKQAAVNEINQQKYKMALYKAAETLYNSDHLTDEYEKRTFITKAASDPVYVIKMLEKLAEASDVAQLGSASRISSHHKEAMINDPVYMRAFGHRVSEVVDD